MPASLYPNPASLSLGNLDLIMMENSYETVDSRSAAEQIALQLALLQQQDPAQPGQHLHQNSSSLSQNGLHQNGGSHIPNHHDHGHNLLNGHGGGQSGSLEDLKNTQRRSQNMTECVPVPSSEHVAEIVGRQGKTLGFFFKVVLGVVLIGGEHVSVSSRLESIAQY